MPQRVVEEWTKLLEKEGYVEIEYKLTVPYIFIFNFYFQVFKFFLQEKKASFSQ